MGIADSVKGSFIKSAVSHLTDGNTGSTWLGATGAAILAANIDFSKVARGFHDEQSGIECGKLAGVAVVALWGWYTGRRKPEGVGGNSEAQAKP